MDLFNKKKVAALRDENTLLTAKLEATTKELDELNTKVLSSYKELSEYFEKKYKDKYLKCTRENGILYFYCKEIWYSGGLVYILHNYLPLGLEDQMELHVNELNELKMITKQEFNKQKLKGESK